VTGPYVSLGGGTSLANPVNYNYENYGPEPVEEGNAAITPDIAYTGAQTGKFLFKPSYAGDVSVGYGFGDGFRVELEGNLYRNTLSKDDNDASNGGEQYKAHGAQWTYGALANVLYDIPVGLPVFPYVGAGAGYEFVKYSPHIDDTDSFGDTVEGTHGSFAYQLIAGIAYPLPMVPGLSLTLDYRFMMLTASRNYASTYPVPGGSSDGPVKIGQQSSHTFLLGLRYQLFPPPPAPAPAPAPVAAPAPAPAKTYLVFFDWDKSTLTPRATQIIAEAASDSKTTGTTTIDVSGYTDTSGTPVYNQGLSERRAKAVAGQLVADGVPMSEIETHAFGETHLLVPTGPGVREPQNRRVEIVLD
jgi:outer membrane protein OmpA-like peptidoglycan-associated protein